MKEAASSVHSQMLLTSPAGGGGAVPGGAGSLGRASIKPVKTCPPRGRIKDRKSVV